MTVTSKSNVMWFLLVLLAIAVALVVGLAAGSDQLVKEEGPIFWAKEEGPIFWGKEEGPLFWGKEEGPLFWGKEEGPLFWG